MTSLTYHWVAQLQGLVHELERLGGRHRRLVAVTVSVPPGAPIDAAERLLSSALVGAGHPGVQVTARPGHSLQILAAEFAR